VALFEDRAKRERNDQERKEHLRETACFYRRLATITPTFPQGYRTNSKATPKSDRWAARAEECRAIADCLTDSECREQMMGLADTYDRLAVAAE
jgi:hypothetical protein